MKSKVKQTNGVAKIDVFKEDRKREIAFHKMNDVLKDLVPCSPQFEDFELALELRKIDYNIEPADALHLAIAMNKKAHVFVTFGERELVSNERIKQFCKEKSLKIESLG